VAGRPLITARVRAAAVLVVAYLAVSLPAGAAAAPPAEGGAGWTTWGDSPLRQSRASSSALTRANAKKLKLAWSRPLGGTGAAQPLYLRRIVSGGKRRDIYVAASESGRVSAFDARSGKLLWSRELGSIETGCLQMPKGVFGVTGTPVYDPAGGYLYVAATDRLWALNVHDGAPRGGWPIALPIDQFHEHVWGAIALANGHVYFAIASYCDRRPYSGRVFSVSTTSGALDHTWTAVTTPGGEPGGGGIWGWGGVAVTSDGHIWAASANANISSGADEATDHAESVVELSSSLALLGSSHAPGMPHRGDFGFGSTPIVFNAGACGALVAAEGKDGAVYLWRRSKLAAGPIQRLVLAFPATLYGSPAWDPKTQQLFLTSTQGYAGQPAGLDALAVTKKCRLRRTWTKGLGGQLSSVPTVANNTVIVVTGTGRLRVYSTARGKLLAQRDLGGAAFSAAIAFGRDVGVVTWGRKLMVFRLPAKH
jgi:outer membrane protein assembly factor BamB